MEPKPTDFVSFADWLGLNEESLSQLEQEAAARALAKAEEAQGALGASYQQAQRAAESGANANISGQASYGDFLRLSRDAQAARRPTSGMSPQELAARGAMPQAEIPDFAAQRNRMQEAVNERVRGREKDIATQEQETRRAQEERATQQKQFDAAAGIYDERLRRDVDALMAGGDAIVGADKRYGSRGDAREDLRRAQARRGYTPWAGYRQGDIDTVESWTGSFSNPSVEQAMQGQFGPIEGRDANMAAAARRRAGVAPVDISNPLNRLQAAQRVRSGRQMPGFASAGGRYEDPRNIDNGGR